MPSLYAGAGCPDAGSHLRAAIKHSTYGTSHPGSWYEGQLDPPAFVSQMLGLKVLPLCPAHQVQFVGKLFHHLCFEMGCQTVRASCTLFCIQV